MGPLALRASTHRRVGERVQDINEEQDEVQYLGLDHGVRLVLEAERLPWVRAYVQRMAWAPDAFVVQPLGDGRVELQALFRAGTLEFAFRTMARLLAKLERGDV